MPNIVSREEWLKARLAHLENEKAQTKARDRLAAERRALPWVLVEKDYRFDTPDGEKSLSDLFAGRSQLVVQHFMLTPGSDHICEGCAFMADHVDAARQHFERADLSFVAISRAPLARIAEVKRRLGWSFDWVSSAGSDFNYDFGVSFTRQQIDKGEPLYNFGTSPYLHEDLHGVSVFAKDDTGRVFHTYSTYARGPEQVIGAFSFLDMTPKGRNETSTMNWVRLHDDYADAPAEAGCCASRAAAE